jgi:hypothetical protein
MEWCCEELSLVQNFVHVIKLLHSVVSVVCKRTSLLLKLRKMLRNRACSVVNVGLS